MGISAVSTKAFNEAHAAPLRVPSAEYGREKAVPVLCQMCAHFCPANAYVKGGKVVRMEASPVHEYKGICGRSRAAVGALYSDDHITTPLIRTGERGDGNTAKRPGKKPLISSGKTQEASRRWGAGKSH